jgi:23S rRNA (guanine2445-N2)-methyltransferase / 23S rRNA (guanine2069-N7)-methyltransferase
LSVLPEVTGVAFEDIRLRTRRRQKGSDQYERLKEREEFHVVAENGLKLRVNLEDYLDTGLFLDHRPTRLRLGREAAGKRFLNLFCYTGAATVHAAAGGAAATLSIDMSRTYLEWARANLALNGLGGDAHRFEQADVLQWLAAQAAAPPGAATAWDLVFLDPPTFSNSARMQGVLDIQRDHARLIRDCMQVLAPDGLLLFSTNAQRFALDTEVNNAFRVADVSPATIPFDFQGNPRIHRCFELRHPPAR